MSTGQTRAVMAGDLQIVAVNAKPSTAMTAALPPKPPGRVSSSSNALVEYTRPLFREESEDYQVKLDRITEFVPAHVSNTSGSSAGSGSGDFHQYRQMRRKEQDRLARMDADYERRVELAEFEIRKRQREEATEANTAKKRAKRQKKKQRKREKRSNKPNAAGEDHQKQDGSDGEDSDKE